MDDWIRRVYWYATKYSGDMLCWYNDSIYPSGALYEWQKRVKFQTIIDARKNVKSKDGLAEINIVLELE